MLHFLFLSLLLLHLLPFSLCSSSENSWCSEGRQRLDSVAFLDCQQQGLSKLHKMGIWITRSLDPNWQVGNQLIINQPTLSTKNLSQNRSPVTASQYASTWTCWTRHAFRSTQTAHCRGRNCGPPGCGRQVSFHFFLFLPQNKMFLEYPPTMSLSGSGRDGTVRLTGGDADLWSHNWESQFHWSCLYQGYARWELLETGLWVKRSIVGIVMLCIFQELSVPSPLPP